VGLGSITSLDDNVWAGAAGSFIAPGMHLSEGIEQCAQSQPAAIHRPTSTEF
jgi:hypothetical protein